MALAPTLDAVTADGKLEAAVHLRAALTVEPKKESNKIDSSRGLLPVLSPFSDQELAAIRTMTRDPKRLRVPILVPDGGYFPTIDPSTGRVGEWEQCSSRGGGLLFFEYSDL